MTRFGIDYPTRGNGVEDETRGYRRLHGGSRGACETWPTTWPFCVRLECRTPRDTVTSEMAPRFLLIAMSAAVAGLAADDPPEAKWPQFRGPAMWQVTSNSVPHFLQANS